MNIEVFHKEKIGTVLNNNAGYFYFCRMRSSTFVQTIEHRYMSVDVDLELTLFCGVLQKFMNCLEDPCHLILRTYIYELMKFKYMTSLINIYTCSFDMKRYLIITRRCTEYCKLANQKPKYHAAEMELLVYVLYMCLIFQLFHLVQYYHCGIVLLRWKCSSDMSGLFSCIAPP